jgi:hypothetical protein
MDLKATPHLELLQLLAFTCYRQEAPHLGSYLISVPTIGSI